MATADVPAEVAPSALRRQALHKVMRTSSGALYGIVDTAIDDRLYDILQAEPDLSEVACLYDGAPAIRYARYAPYLLKLHDGSPLLQRWLHEGWTQHWGIFLSSEARSKELKRHLKKFMQATDHQNRAVWVRFYDPRVLPNWLQGLHPGHLADWFGGATLIVCGAPTPQGLWRGQAQRSTLDQWSGTAALAAQLIKT
jgi:hypothetical protein